MSLCVVCQGETEILDALTRVDGIQILEVTNGNLPWELPPQTEILITRPSRWVSAPKLKPATWPSTLRWIHSTSAGVDAFPDWLLSEATITSSKGPMAHAIAEYVLCALLNFEKHFSEIRVRQPNNWNPIRMGSLEGRTLGLIGFGATGKEVARIARVFGMRVIAYRRQSVGDRETNDASIVTDLYSLLRESDHVVLSVPLTPLTANLIDRRALRHVKKGGHLVNVARGGVIDDAALLEALDSGELAGATLDVMRLEPPPQDHRFYAHPKIFMTPHISWDSPLSTGKLVDLVISNLHAYLRGEPLQNVVDPTAGY